MSGIKIVERYNISSLRTPLDAYMVNSYMESLGLIEGIRRGMEERRRGKVKAWREIKEKLGLG